MVTQHNNFFHDLQPHCTKLSKVFAEEENKLQEEYPFPPFFLKDTKSSKIFKWKKQKKTFLKKYAAVPQTKVLFPATRDKSDTLPLSTGKTIELDVC